MLRRIISLMCICAFWSCNAQTDTTIEVMNAEFPHQKSDAEWRAELTPEQYRILRQKGTERPHTGTYNLHFEEGVYHCAGCKSPLFKSDSKFESHCGWPSFDKALSDSTVVEIPDYSFGMVRIEIVCASCGGHLGHVFDDGPTSTGLRYCINSAAIGFEEETDEE
jgi:peptide-methionine (R)-S-oxide reductase